MIFGIPVFFIVLTVITGRLEKRLVWQYGDLVPQPPYADSAKYALQMTTEALQSGYTLLGWAADPRAPGYRINYALLMSPERDFFVTVSQGSIFKLPTNGTTIYSRTTDGNVFYTTDNQNNVQIDLIWRSQLAPVKNFSDLLGRHQSLLKDKNLPVQPFTAGREAEEFRRMREERYETMARRGLIDYLDASRTSWHFTLWGTLRYTFLNFTIGIVRAQTKGAVFRSI
jgi:hypothetical protein